MKLIQWAQKENQINDDESTGVNRHARKDCWRCGCDFVLSYCFVISSSTIDGSERTLTSAKERAQFPNRLYLQEVIAKQSSNFCHTTRCVPNYKQNVVGVRRTGTLLNKENELVDHLLTVVKWHHVS